MEAPPLVLRDLVLVGGGHAHVYVVRMFGMRPLPGVRVTLVSRDCETPYSGMLPGLVTGAYTPDDCHVDLVRLCAWARVRFLHAACTGLQLEPPPGSTAAGCVLLDGGRPPLRFDVLSLDVGITPHTDGVAGAAELAVAVKPIAGFAARWAQHAAAPAAAQPRALAVVGGGAGGVELALAVAAAGRAKGDSVALFASSLLPGHGAAARARLAEALSAKGVITHSGSRVAALEPLGGSRLALRLACGARHEFDSVFWCTSGAAAPWLATSGLAVDESGCVRVGRTLQSLSHAAVFAAGDCASLTHAPRPKAGVFAVRAGPALEANLRAAVEGRWGRLRGWTPQRRQLALVSLGDGGAVASYGPLALGGVRSPRTSALLGRWKERIDRKWMAIYNRLPAMRQRWSLRRALAGAPRPSPALLRAAGAEAAAAAAAAASKAMRCGGCGAKVGAATLSRVLASLGGGAAAAAEDAAAVRLPSPLCLASVDFFRSLIDDPFALGAIAATHALGDAWAMGCVPQAALAIAQLPHAPAEQTERELGALMAGALDALQKADCPLVGGHSCEGAETAVGFAVLASPPMGPPGALPLPKGGLLAGQLLILTKPLGTGIIMAAHAKGGARGRDVAAALASMRLPGGGAAAALRAAGASGCTDVTGFGLLGHAAEMAAGGGIALAFDMEALPLLPGAAAAAAAGEASSLAPANEAAGAAALGVREWREGLPAAARAHPAFPLLTDPQTAGGLLAGVPAAQAAAALRALRAAGCHYAAVVGEVLPAMTGEPRVVLRLGASAATQADDRETS